MSNWGYDENDNAQAGNTPDGPKALRDAYDAMKKQNDELTQKLTSFLEDQNRQKMASVFETLGVPGAQSVYQGEADPEKAKQWVESMRSVFAGNTQVAPAPVADAVPAFTDAQKHQMQMMTAAGQNEAPLGNFEAAQTGISSATSTNELVALMQKLQGGA